MNIVIVGCGKIGGELIEELAGEGHDIVVIDNDKAVVDLAANSYDIIGLHGNGASRLVQTEAGVANSDLLIAVTSSDELNMLCCLTAKKLGASNTIARVRNPEYIDQLEFLSEDLGLSMHINPEFDTAVEVFRMIRFPSVQKIETFAEGRAEIVEIRATEDLKLHGVMLKDLTKITKVKILVCAVQRGDEVFIPDGNFSIENGDKLSITGAPSEVGRLFHDWGIQKRKINRVMIIGAGRVAYYLCRMLLDSGVKVKVIEKDEKRCRALSEAMPKVVVIMGDGSDQELLHEEGIENAGAFVALTGFDEENLIMSLYANSLEVGKTIAKVNRSGLISLVDRLDIGGIVSPKLISANLILRYVRAMQNSLGSNVETLHKIIGGKAEALEFRVRGAVGVAGIPLKNLKTKDNLLIACIIRRGRIIIPGGTDEIRNGDRVLVVTTKRHLGDISDILA